VSPVKYERGFISQNRAFFILYFSLEYYRFNYYFPLIYAHRTKCTLSFIARFITRWGPIHNTTNTLVAPLFPVLYSSNNKLLFRSMMLTVFSTRVREKRTMSCDNRVA
jgi:hypothetical protein